MICPKCNGDAWQHWQEDGRWVRDPCYHCGNTGQVSEEQYFHDQLAEVANVLAWSAVSHARKAANENPDGEGWAFAAAENRISEWDYTQGVFFDYQDRFLCELAALDVDLQRALIDTNNQGVTNQPSQESKDDKARASCGHEAAVGGSALPF